MYTFEENIIMAATRIEMQHLLENESELRKQREETAEDKEFCQGVFSLNITLSLVQLVIAVHTNEVWKIKALLLSLLIQVSVQKSSYFPLKYYRFTSRNGILIFSRKFNVR